ncbi:MAG: RNA polymerase subunit Rpo13 [Thermoprotei archaeon]
MSQEEVHEAEEVEELEVEARGAQEYPVGEEAEEIPELSVNEIEGLLMITEAWDKLLAGEISPREAERTFVRLGKGMAKLLKSRRGRKSIGVEEEAQEEEEATEEEEGEKKKKRAKSSKKSSKKKSKKEDREEETSEGEGEAS